MAQQDESREFSYPIGRGYGHDYMRGGEVLGGYGYSERAEYERRRGEQDGEGADEHADGRSLSETEAPAEETRRT